MIRLGIIHLSCPFASIIDHRGDCAMETPDASQGEGLTSSPTKICCRPWQYSQERTNLKFSMKHPCICPQLAFPISPQCSCQNFHAITLHLILWTSSLAQNFPIMSLAAVVAIWSVTAVATYCNCSLTSVKKIVRTSKVLHVQTNYRIITSTNFSMLMYIGLSMSWNSQVVNPMFMPMS
jgi:hypothetical protein